MGLSLGLSLAVPLTMGAEQASAGATGLGTALAAFEVGCTAGVETVAQGAGLPGLSEGPPWGPAGDGPWRTGSLLWRLMVIFCFLGCSGAAEGLFTDQLCTEVEACTGLALLTLELPLGLDMQLPGASFNGPVPFN